MEKLIALLVHGAVLAIQQLPLKWVARLGRAGGAIAWYVDARHRRVMLENIRQAFPQWDSVQVRETARENMKRIGENYASALKTAVMEPGEILQICDVVGTEKFPEFGKEDGPKNCVVAIGHFGNFELYAQIARNIERMRGATTYRGLKQPGLNAIMQMLRQKSGCLFFERRSEAEQLRSALNEGGILLGLLSDQHAGNSGVWSPFLGRNCSTTPAAAILALRYRAPLFTAICYRTSLGRWTIELGDEIPTQKSGKARSVEALVGDINRALEAAVIRDPANWFWVHNRWKPRKLKPNRSPSGATIPQADPVMDIASP